MKIIDSSYQTEIKHLFILDHPLIIAIAYCLLLIIFLTLFVKVCPLIVEKIIIIISDYLNKNLSREMIIK